jgi:RNA polymerase sigma factor (sigma-70 family)
MMHGPFVGPPSPPNLVDPPREDSSDRALLDRFVRRRDDAAFEVLVQRYGSLVLGVCRRILGDGPDAEDAFQAVFMVLVDRAASLTRPELLGNWLYGVACRVASKARAKRSRRNRREPPPPPPPPTEPSLEAAWRELWGVLDEELQRLPEEYRAPLTLCYLDGLSNQEAARRLGWPSGSISYRLARGRELLRDRLRRRCPKLPPALLLVLPAWPTGLAEVPLQLLELTVRLAVRLAADTWEAVEELAPEVMRLVAESRKVRRAASPLWLRLAAALLAALTLLGAGWAVAAGIRARPEQPTSPCPSSTGAEEGSHCPH